MIFVVKFSENVSKRFEGFCSRTSRNALINVVVFVSMVRMRGIDIDNFL